MKSKFAQTHTVRIWIAGNLAQAEEICRKFCEGGMCVSVSPVNYIYTGGEQSGVVVTFINYARFPRLPEDLNRDAIALANELLVGLHQTSFSIEYPDQTVFYSNRDYD